MGLHCPNLLFLSCTLFWYIFCLYWAVIWAGLSKNWARYCGHMKMMSPQFHILAFFGLPPRKVSPVDNTNSHLVSFNILWLWLLPWLPSLSCLLSLPVPLCVALSACHWDDGGSGDLGHDVAPWLAVKVVN
jgi:hypothetical protein